MDPDLPECRIADVVESTAGRDAGKLFYVIDTDGTWLTLVNGKDRTLEKPKRKKQKHTRWYTRPDTCVSEKLRNGETVLNSELRKDLAYLSNTIGG